MESAHTQLESLSQNDPHAAERSKKPVRRTENDSTLDPPTHDIEAASAEHEDAQSIGSNSAIRNVDFFLGIMFGLIAGPLSLLIIKCWRGMAQHDIRRAQFSQGCSMGIIFQIIGLAIAFSVYKLSTSRTS